LCGLSTPKMITDKKVDKINKCKITLQKYENPHFCGIPE